MSEAFVYLWYDAPNKMYYLGKHKGTPDDTYTHSSRTWKSFTKDNIPKGVRRRVLTYGTDEEMTILENKLLINRRDHCWDRYYNNSLGDPRYIDTSGKNNPMYKHGKTIGYRNNPEVQAAYDKEYNQTPYRKEYNRLKELRRPPRDRRLYWKEYSRRKKYESTGEGSLEGFLT